MTDLILPNNASYFNFRQSLPDERLRTWVQCLWSTGGQRHLTEPRTEKLYPDAGASLNIKLANSRPGITFCFNNSTLFKTVSGSDTCLGIRFKPAGAYGLLGLAPEQFSDKLYRLDTDINPPWMDSLMSVVERLYTLDAQQGLNLLEVWLLHLLENQPPANSRISTIVQTISRLQLPPQQISAEVGFTRRTLERKLKREVGASPGQLVAYGRLRNARHWLLESNAPLATIALNCGYFDQAHFTHAFQSLTYETPGAYRNRKLSQIYKA